MKLGIDACAYLNTATLPAGWTAPVWEEMDFISDLTEKSDWDTADVIIRRSWVKQGAKTVVDVGVSCRMLREPGNPLYQAILNALRTRDTVDVLILDASIDTVGAEGIRYVAQVNKGGGSQNTGDALFREIEFIPFPDEDVTHVPMWADVEVAGTATFTPITEGAGGALFDADAAADADAFAGPAAADAPPGGSGGRRPGRPAAPPARADQSGEHARPAGS